MKLVAGRRLLPHEDFLTPVGQVREEVTVSGEGHHGSAISRTLQKGPRALSIPDFNRLGQDEGEL